MDCDGEEDKVPERETRELRKEMAKLRAAAEGHGSHIHLSLETACDLSDHG